MMYFSDLERLFFIYDQAILDDQDADIKDSVLYCCPKLVSTRKWHIGGLKIARHFHAAH